MRKAILRAASALAPASPAVAADLSHNSPIPSYKREALPYEYRTAPPVVVEEAGSRRFRDGGGSPASHCSAAAEWWLRNIRSIRFGVTDGAIGVNYVVVGNS
jgi:hypothetical protein